MDIATTADRPTHPDSSGSEWTAVPLATGGVARCRLDLIAHWQFASWLAANEHLVFGCAVRSLSPGLLSSVGTGPRGLITFCTPATLLTPLTSLPCALVSSGKQ